MSLGAWCTRSIKINHHYCCHGYHIMLHECVGGMRTSFPSPSLLSLPGTHHGLFPSIGGWSHINSRIRSSCAKVSIINNFGDFRRQSKCSKIIFTFEVLVSALDAIGAAHGTIKLHPQPNTSNCDIIR